jgi:glucuronosyltransferase
MSVVWSIPAENYQYLPNDAVVSKPSQSNFLQNDRFLFQNWVPQASLLAHNSTKLFITHCGMGGTLESLASSIPLVCIPIWADQFGVATRVVSAGAGLQLKNGDVHDADLEQAIQRTLADASFKRHAERLSKLLKFAGGANKAADLILLFLDIGGQGEHLVNYFDLAPSWRYQITLISILVAPLLLVVSVVKKLWAFACNKRGRRADKTKVE